jgi:hypothetical protein
MRAATNQIGAGMPGADLADANLRFFKIKTSHDLDRTALRCTALASFVRSWPHAAYRKAAQIAAIDNSDLAIMAHHPILDHNDTAGSLDHQPNSEGL